MTEIEIKALCDNPDDVAARITYLNGKFSTRRTERDIYFNHPCRDFRTTDEAFRIRITGRKNILTYKGPKLSKKTKTRHEEEVAFDDAGKMEQILQVLGFNRVAEIRKERDIYVMDDITISIDRVRDVGTYVELEKINGDIGKGEDDLFSLALRLGLDRFETRSYLELYLERFPD